MSETENTLIEQYRRCCEDWRHYDRILWEISFSTLVVTGSLLTLVFAWVREVFPRIILILCLLIFVVMMMFLAVKIRFFQEARCEFAKDIERKLNIKTTPIETKESLEYLDGKDGEIIIRHPFFSWITKRIVRQRVFYVQLVFYLSLICLLGILLIWHVFQLILMAIN